MSQSRLLRRAHDFNRNAEVMTACRLSKVPVRMIIATGAPLLGRPRPLLVRMDVYIFVCTSVPHAAAKADILIAATGFEPVSQP